MKGIRRERTSAKKSRAAVLFFLFLALGAALGIASKFLDATAVNELPSLFERLDITNFLGRPAIWVFLAVLISCRSGSPFRAAWYVFAFFLGMVGSYYLYSWFVAGFFPRSYAMIWFGITLVSPLLAFLCWHAKGEGILSIILSSCILAVMINFTFAYGAFYADLVSPLEFILLLATLVLLRRKRKQMVSMTVLAIALALAMHSVSIQGLPIFWGY